MGNEQKEGDREKEVKEIIKEGIEEGGVAVLKGGVS